MLPAPNDRGAGYTKEIESLIVKNDITKNAMTVHIPILPMGRNSKSGGK